MRAHIHARIDSAVKEQLRVFADQRDISMAQVIEAALAQYLDPEDYKTVSLEYLASIERRHQVVLKRLDMLLELLGKYVLVWFMNTPDPEDADLKSAMARKGASRYDKFLDKVNATLGNARSVRRAFEERTMAAEDFDFDGSGGQS